jgi:hypothetical protein
MVSKCIVECDTIKGPREIGLTLRTMGRKKTPCNHLVFSKDGANIGP